MAQEKRGYALKTERGERPFIYSQEHADWFRSPSAQTAERWAKRFGMSPRRRFDVEA